MQKGKKRPGSILTNPKTTHGCYPHTEPNQTSIYPEREDKLTQNKVHRTPPEEIFIQR